MRTSSQLLESYELVPPEEMLAQTLSPPLIWQPFYCVGNR